MINPNASETEPLTIVEPRTKPVPVLFDSPHSGSHYPDDFNAVLEHQALRVMEDAFVDELFAAAPDHGAALIAARFPRGYIDPNRSELEIDPKEFEGWDGPAEPTEKSHAGKGLIWTRLHGAMALYTHNPTAADVHHRINTYWRPYHQAINDAYDNLHRRFGCVYHVDCHSMRAKGNAFDPDGVADRPDFVISNHDGQSCAPTFLDLVVDHLQGRGFNVAVNDPYKGAELTRRYADPANNRHALQIEINRRLYMDEKAVVKSPDFSAFVDQMTALTAVVCDFATSQGTET
jgi:N-formylglutamate deformylase